jgi:serine protease Do
MRSSKTKEMAKMMRRIEDNNDELKGEMNMYQDNDFNDYKNYKEIEVEDTTLEMNENVKTKTKKNSKIKGAMKLTATALAFGLIAGVSFQGYNYAVGGNNASSVESTNTSVISTNSKSEDDISAVTTASSSSSVSSDVSQVVENVMPSIVSITSTSTYNTSDMFGRTYSDEATGSGSGIIIGENDTEILIATNNHVVADATKVQVTFNDESVVDATIKGTNSNSDLAVVGVEKSAIKSDTLSNIKVATLGDSTKLKVGSVAIAIGNALGYGQSVTVGYISALNREVTFEDGSMTLLQTDAAINPGNSGGALLNSNGEVIGINSSKYSSEEVEGMGFAIPISDAIPIINALMNKETIPESEQAYMGIMGADVTEEYSQRFGMPIGVYVNQVSSSSSAEKAGLVEGDIITAIDDNKVETMEDLQEFLATYRAGDTATITYSQQVNGTYSEKTLKITFGSKSEASSN